LAVKLRLKRMGKKRQPIYKVVAADSRSPRDGKFIEALGNYNPRTEPQTIEINAERAIYWLGCGAEPTATVKNLLSKNGILYQIELKKQGVAEEEIAKKMEEWKATHQYKAKNSVKKASKVETNEEVKGAASEEGQS